MTQASTKKTYPEFDDDGRYLSLQSASLALAILLLASDKARFAQLVALVLRRPDILRNFVVPLSASFGASPIPEPDENVTPSTKEELIAIVEPILKDGTKLAAFARIFDLYLLRNPPTPDTIVYTLYTIIRYGVARENTPTREQNKLIWSTTLLITRTSIVGGRHWEELEAIGEVYLNDWLRKVKENARKRFRTFLNQKRRMELSAELAFRKLFALFFE